MFEYELSEIVWLVSGFVVTETSMNAVGRCMSRHVQFLLLTYRASEEVRVVDACASRAGLWVTVYQWMIAGELFVSEFQFASTVIGSAVGLGWGEGQYGD